MTNCTPWSARVYRRLLVLYPEDLRRDFGADMALVFADDLDQARRESGMRGVARVWRCSIGEFVRYGLSGCASRPTMRVFGISVALLFAMMSGVMAMAQCQSTRVLPLSYKLGVVFAMPLFSTPLLFLLSLWICRGSSTVSLDLSGGRR
jgi:hypothetical protein